MSKQTTAERREIRNKAKPPGSTITTSNSCRIVKIARDDPKWHDEAYNVLVIAYGYPKACGECGYPVISGYCCSTCGSDAP